MSVVVSSFEEMPDWPEACDPLNLVERPDHDVLTRREVHHGVDLGHSYGRHRVEIDPCGRRCQLPGPVMDVSPVQSATVLCVEAVALRQKVLQRPRLDGEEFALRAVGRAERLPVAATAVEHELVVATAQ